MMDMQLAEILQKVSIWAVPVLLAITLHEAAHGYVARLNGDNTAWMLGRVTLNPLKHIDPLGTVILPLILMMTSPFIFGWAKPVPVNYNQLRRKKMGAVLVAGAGPAANLFLALCSVVLFHLVPYVPETIREPMALTLIASMQINVLLMVFNLMPILPLDGGRILEALLPGPLSYKYARTERYGMIIVIVLAFTGILFAVIKPIMVSILGALSHLLP